MQGYADAPVRSSVDAHLLEQGLALKVQHGDHYALVHVWTSGNRRGLADLPMVPRSGCCARWFTIGG
jgi:hypothetical protein